MVHVAEVDCVEEQHLCREQDVRSYPNVKLYTLGTHGVGKVR